MSDASEKKSLDPGRIFREELRFAVKMFTAPIMAVVREVRERWRDVDTEVDRTVPKGRGKPSNLGSA
jgi:hypothetical protein